MADVLIFDDDPSVGDLMSEVLRGRGLTVSHFLSGAGVVQLVQENKPRLVMLDIMMPGMDGLTACRTLKSNPATRAVKIVVLTAKDYGEDRESALRYGADVFLNKPFEPGNFSRAVAGMLGIPEPPPPGSQPPMPPVAVTVLPGAAVVESAALWVVLDAGAGLGGWLAKQSFLHPLTWMLLSRCENEAVSELPAAAKLAAGGCRVNLAGPDDPESRLQQAAPPLCATLPDGRRATPLLYPQREGEFSLAPGARAAARLTQHPGAALAYRLDVQGKSVVYCPAHEIVPDLAKRNKHEHEKFRTFFSGADLLIHGYARSLAAPPPPGARLRGAWEPVLDLASAAGVKHLVLVAQGAGAPVEGMLLRVEERLVAIGSKMRCSVLRQSERVIL